MGPYNPNGFLPRRFVNWASVSPVAVGCGRASLIVASTNGSLYNDKSSFAQLLLNEAKKLLTKASEQRVLDTGKSWFHPGWDHHWTYPERVGSSADQQSLL